MYVLESDGEPAGQIRYEIENGDAEINFSVGKDYRGKGLGYRLLILGGRSLLMEHPEVHTIHGYVMENNESSKRSFMRAGFYAEKYENIEGRKSMKYIFQISKSVAGFHS
jgi:RimJ/RimL family protein N-acetyltransferase